MLTPQEATQRSFSKAVMGGYNMAMVDEFLDALIEDYTTLYKENAVLKSKMKVLVDKVEEYRSTEDAMRTALLAAQKMAESMVEEAKNKREELMETAETDARGKINELQHQIASEQLRLTAAQKEKVAFVEKMRNWMASEMAFLDKLDEISAPHETAGGESLDSAVQEIESSVSRILAEDLQDEPGSEPPPEETAGGGLYSDILNGKLPEDAPEDRESDEITRKIDLKTLQFGRNYELK